MSILPFLYFDSNMLISAHVLLCFPRQFWATGQITQLSSLGNKPVATVYLNRAELFEDLPYSSMKERKCLIFATDSFLVLGGKVLEALRKTNRIIYFQLNNVPFS